MVIPYLKNDAFEAIVELFFQLQGYITSSGKWFWVYDSEKKQRGYRDIDVLAINGEETVIISVTSNLDDKIRIHRSSNLNDPLYIHTTAYFKSVQLYLENVPSYRWLLAHGRIIRKVIVSVRLPKTKRLDEIKITLEKDRIELIGAKEIFEFLNQDKFYENVKIQNQMQRVLQISKLIDAELI
jgi:hypothetical protein